jgi:hypothetical protein
MVKNWTGFSTIHTHEWTTNLSIDEWWTLMSYKASPIRKGIASLTMLVSWTIWKEQNARVFNNKAAPPTILLEIIKSEAKLWSSAGANT